MCSSRAIAPARNGGARGEIYFGRFCVVTPAILAAVCAAWVLAAGAARAQDAAPPLRETTALPEPRQMHGAAVLGDYLYVISGVITGENPYTDTVLKSKIYPDSSLGMWEQTTPLPTNRSYVENSTIVLNDVLYVVGGWDHKANLGYHSVLWTRPMPDGHLEPWRESAAFPSEANHCLTAVATPGQIHIIGGLGGNDVVAPTVISGRVAPTGEILHWQLGPPLPTPLWFHNAVALRGRVWVWAGLTLKANTSVSQKVFSAPILSTGGLGQWQEEFPSLPVGFYSAAGASAGPYLLSFSPRLSGAVTTTDIWFAAVTPSGLTQWIRTPSALSATRYLPAAPDYRRGTIYIPGGRIDKVALENRVFYFALSPSARQVAENIGVTAAAQNSTVSVTDSMAAAQAGAAQAPPSGLAYQAQMATPAGAISGFVSLAEARRLAAGPPPRPILLYFHLDGPKPCADQVEKLRGDASFATLAQQAAFAWVDIRQSPQLAQQLGVYRVPTWVLYNSREQEIGRVTGVLTPEQLAAGIASAR